MATDPQSRMNVRFGQFEVDFVAAELRKRGVRIKLQKQPFQILTALLERPNEVVTRGELREKVWTGDTFVDFEHGLNAAVNKLRQALADAPENPRYIETVAGIGYRWLAPIETIAATSKPMPTAIEALPAQASAQPARSRTWVRWVLLATMLAGGVVAGWFLRSSTGERVLAHRLVEFTLTPPEGFFWEPALTRQDFAVSPDGERIAFVASDMSRSQLWMREIRSLRSYPLAPDRNVRGVVWSPDGRYLYFDERTTVRRVSPGGEAVQTICDLPLGPPWMGLLRSSDQFILYTRAGTYQVPAPGGTARQLDKIAYGWTQALPGDYVLRVQYAPEIHRYRAFATSLTNPAEKRALVESDSRALYAPPAPGQRTGFLLYMRAGSLMAHPFDAKLLRLAGDPVAVAQNVFSFAPTGAAAFSVSENGVLVYRTADSRSQLKWFDRTGREGSNVGQPATFLGQFRLSPDGKKLAAPIYDVEKGGIDIWIYDLTQGSRRKLTNAPGVSNPPVWSPDGTRIVFARAQGATPKLYWRGVDESAKEEPLTPAYFQLPTDWSSDGRLIAYQTSGGMAEPVSDVSLIDISNSRRIVPLLQSPSRELGAVFHPNGKFIAFLSDATGRAEVYVQALESYPEARVTGESIQISKDGASVIRWGLDGKELLYLNGDNWLVSVPVAMRNGGVSFGSPQRLFRTPTPPRNLNGGGPDWGFDVSKDGQRFLLIDGRSSSPVSLVVMLNWYQAMRSEVGPQHTSFQTLTPLY